jgi:hypothetical protein
VSFLISYFPHKVQLTSLMSNLPLYVAVLPHSQVQRLFIHIFQPHLLLPQISQSFLPIFQLILYTHHSIAKSILLICQFLHFAKLLLIKITHTTRVLFKEYLQYPSLFEQLQILNQQQFY